MNTSELAELFLTSLYDLAESEGHSKLFCLNDFATKIGTSLVLTATNTHEHADNSAEYN